MRSTCGSAAERSSYARDEVARSSAPVERLPKSTGTRRRSLPKWPCFRADGQWTKQHKVMDMARRPPGQVVMVVEGWRQRGHNEGTSLREDAGYDEKC